MSTDKSAAAIRELAYKHAEPKVIWNDGNMSIYPDEEKIESLLSDLTALIEEHYVAKEEVDKMVSERLGEALTDWADYWNELETGHACIMKEDIDEYLKTKIR